jgi:lathosterol oxidase
MCQTLWKKQADEVDKMVDKIEGEDDWKYLPQEAKKIR